MLEDSKIIELYFEDYKSQKRLLDGLEVKLDVSEDNLGRRV